MSNSIELSGIFSEGYGFVPKKLMKAKDISSNTKLVLCYLLSYTGAGCTAFPQQKDIAESLGISMRTVVKCIHESIENGYLKKIQEQRGQGIGKRNIYDLLFMREFPSARNAHANIARANDDVASAKNDTLQVHHVHTNNNNKNNNNMTRPSIDQLKEYITEKGYHVNAEKWYAYYESNGWKVGRNPMKSWKGAVATWEHSDFNKQKDNSVIKEAKKNDW